MILRDPNELIPYILEADRGEEGAPVFYYKPFNIGDYYKFKGRLVSRINRGDLSDMKPEAIELINENEVLINLFEHKVVKVTGVKFPGEDTIQDITDRDDILRLKGYMQVADILEVSSAIQNDITVSENESKK